MASYRQYTYHTGSVTEVVKTYGYRTNKKVQRQPNYKKTNEAQEKINKIRSRNHFRRIVNLNFNHKAMHVVLRFAPEFRNLTKQEVREHTRKFFRKLKEKVEKAGRKLKYVYTSEYGSKSIHHHVIIKGAKRKEIIDLWSWGRPNFVQLDKSGQYKQLSDYLLKQTSKTFNDPKRQIYKTRWCSSANIRIPVPIIEVVSASSWREYPKVPKGYILDHLEAGVYDETGYPYQFYSLTKIEPLSNPL